MKKAILSLIGMLLLSGTLQAQPGRTPPEEAFTACSGSSAGSACSFQGMRGDTISGTCGSPPGMSDGKMLCMPSNMRGGPGGMGGQDGNMQGGQQGQSSDHRGPPAEAISACSGSSEGSTCSFQGMRGDMLNGTCRSYNDQLACAPEGMPMGGGMNGGNRGPK